MTTWHIEQVICRSCATIMFIFIFTHACASLLARAWNISIHIFSRHRPTGSGAQKKSQTLPEFSTMTYAHCVALQSLKLVPYGQLSWKSEYGAKVRFVLSEIPLRCMPALSRYLYNVKESKQQHACRQPCSPGLAQEDGVCRNVSLYLSQLMLANIPQVPQLDQVKIWSLPHW